MSTPPRSAPLRRRSLAFVIDIACCALPLVLVSPVIVLFWTSGQGDSQFAAAMMVAMNTALGALLYHAGQLVQGARDRPTPGRKLLGLTVTTLDGQRPGAARRCARAGLPACFAAGVLFSGLYPLLAVPALWALIDARGRALTDALLGTLVSDDAAGHAGTAQVPAPATPGR